MQPIFVGQIGKAFAAARVRPMALRTVVHEQAITNGHGLGIFGHILRWHACKFAIRQGVDGMEFVGVAEFDICNDLLQERILLCPVGSVSIGYGG
jgi:hypothetical protein